MTDDSTLARIVSERPRFKTIDLDWTVAFGGKDYRTITVSRLTAAEVARFQSEIEQLLTSNPDAKVRLPLFRDEHGAPIPDEVMDALDDDDRLALDVAAANFLPRRFQGLAERDFGPTLARLPRLHPEISGRHARRARRHVLGRLSGRTSGREKTEHVTWPN